MLPRSATLFFITWVAGACFVLLTSASPLQSVEVGENVVSEERADEPSMLFWKNDLNLVHVVNTHFVQHQTKLTHLEEARFDLLKTVTAPSMLQQTSDQHLWIIWTDSTVEDGSFIANGLKEVASQFPNAVVVKGEQDKTRTLRDLYGTALMEHEPLELEILAGDANLLFSYKQASQSRLLVETYLDADDALSGIFIESTQAGVAAAMRDAQANKHQHVCPETHLDARGLVQHHNKAFCIKSGWTVASFPEGHNKCCFPS